MLDRIQAALSWALLLCIGGMIATAIARGEVVALLTIIGLWACFYAAIRVVAMLDNGRCAAHGWRLLTRVKIWAIRRTLRRTIETDPVPVGFLPSGSIAYDCAAMDQLYEAKRTRIAALKTTLADHCERLQHLRAGR
jgi:hypothetical protein